MQVLVFMLVLPQYLEKESSGPEKVCKKTAIKSCVTQNLRTNIALVLLETKHIILMGNLYYSQRRHISTEEKTKKNRRMT